LWIGFNLALFALAYECKIVIKMLNFLKKDVKEEVQKRKRKKLKARKKKEDGLNRHNPGIY